MPYPAPGEAGQVIPFETFYRVYCELLRQTGYMTRLRTLQDAPDRSGCREAAASLYDTLIDVVPSLLTVGNKWLIRASVFGAWALPLGIGCAAEIRQRRAEAASEGPTDAADDGSSSPERERPKTQPGVTEG